MSVIEVVADVALVAGASMSMFAGLAVLRFPNTPARVHAATKPQVLGIMLLMLGLGLHLGTWAVVGQLVLIVVLQFLTAPVSAHLVVREAYRSSNNDAGPATAEANNGVGDEAARPGGGENAGEGTDPDTDRAAEDRP